MKRPFNRTRLAYNWQAVAYAPNPFRTQACTSWASQPQAPLRWPPSIAHDRIEHAARTRPRRAVVAASATRAADTNVTCGVCLSVRPATC